MRAVEKPYPQFYSKWLDGLLPTDLQMPVIDCQTCEMTSPRVSKPFSKNLKCCTYAPFIPNFSIGHLLQSQGAAFELRLRVAAERGQLNPLGLFPAPNDGFGADVDGFGRDEQRRCSFLDPVSIACTIWNARPGVCASYFCPPGEFAERKALESFLNTFEWTMAHEALYRLGFTDDEIQAMHSGDSHWLEWRGREIELFKATHQACSELKRLDLVELMKEEVAAFAGAGAGADAVTLAQKARSC